MRRRLATRLLWSVVLAGALGLALAAPVGEPSRLPVSHSQARELRQMVARMLASAPRRGDGYQSPSAEQLRLAAAMLEAAVAGRTATARRLGRAIGYDVVELDARTGRLTVLREAPGHPRGWGLYAFLNADPSDLNVEVPHPISDLNTAEAGLELFIRGSGAALLVAGAHRHAASSGAADVAHRADSLFEIAHRAALTRESVVVQPHGFHAAHDRRFEAVVSSGQVDPSREAEAAAEALARARISTCLYGVHDCDDLGGTTNTQGDSTMRAHATFIHVELSIGLRTDPARRAELVRALLGALVE